MSGSSLTGCLWLQVRDHYLPEVEALVRSRVPGADHPDAKVLIFDVSSQASCHELLAILGIFG